MDVLAEACRQGREDKVLWLLQQFVPEFQAVETEQMDLGAVI